MAKRSKVVSRKVCVAVHVNAMNNSSGNPRRGWIVYDTQGRKLGFVDEGYSGKAALTKAFPKARATWGWIGITPKEYGSLRKNAVN